MEEKAKRKSPSSAGQADEGDFLFYSIQILGKESEL